MEQKLVYLHTDKNLKETEEILKKQGMEIILKSNSIFQNFSDLTEEEQLSYLKTIEVELDNTSDKLEIQDKEIEILTRKGYSFSKEFRKIIDSLKNSKDPDTTKRFQHLQVEYKKIRELEHTIDQLRYRARDLNLYDEVRCSCLIAKMGTNVIRYLAFENDPVLTITGPNAHNLKSILEKKF